VVAGERKDRPAGRLYLATEPTLLRLRDRRESNEVQFILMPYPTPSRYLRDEAGQKYSSPEERNQKLMTAFLDALRTIQSHERFDRTRPTVLAAHVHVRGATVGASLFRLAEQEDVIIPSEGLPAEFAYVALGHVHKPQAIGGREHIRYSGSIERMDLGESADAKSIVLFDGGPPGLIGPPQLLPLEATAIYEIDIRTPSVTLPELRKRYPDASADLVNLHVTYTAGVDSLEDVLKQAEEIFPRYYARDWTESGALGPALMPGEGSGQGKGFEETVREYVKCELTNYSDVERAEILERLNRLLAEER